jgi:hypothetical protein
MDPTQDPLLRQLIDLAYEHEAPVPLALYLPWGRVTGYLAGQVSFDSFGQDQLEDWDSIRPVFGGRRNDDDYIYLRNATCSPKLVERHFALRVRLSDVSAWTMWEPPPDARA